MAVAIERYAKIYDLVILAGETAIQDRYDIAPRAIERMGGTIEIFGVPVDPGNLLLLAYAGQIPIVGAPGCARSSKDNIVDIVLPRLLAGDHLTQNAMIEYAHGGLLEDVPERPLPRSKID
jgi:molybdenum cofactor cytidylyltransferase